MTERDVLLDVARRLDKLQLSYMLTGSLASMYYGVAPYIENWAAQLTVAVTLPELRQKP